MGSKKQQRSDPPSRRAQRFEQRRRQARRRIGAWISGVLAVAAIVLVVVRVAGGGGDGAPPFAGSTLDVILGDYVIEGNLTAPAGEVRLHAVNNGGASHNVGIKGGPMSFEVGPGRSTTVDLGSLAPGTYHLICDVEDHEARGMVADLIVTAPAQPAVSTT